MPGILQEVILKRVLDVSTTNLTPLDPVYSHPRRPGGSQSGREKRRDESFQVCFQVFGYLLSLNYFQKFKRMPARDWAQKMLCIIVPDRRNSFSSVLFVSSYTTTIVAITACLDHAPKKCKQ